MPSNLVIYAPFNVEPRRLGEVERVVAREAKKLRLPVIGPFLRRDSRICVTYEDERVKCYIFVDDYDEPLNIEKVALTIRFMALISISQARDIELEMV